MQLAAKYKRPAIVARLNDEGYIRGSARGCNNSALSSFKNYLASTGLFEYTQGHDNAFGMSIPQSKVNALLERANIDLPQYKFGENCYEVNFVRYANSLDLVDLIMNLGNYSFIWSQGNPEPYLDIQDIIVSSNEISIIGSKKDTIRFEKYGVTYIKFHAQDLIEEFSKHNEVRMEIVGRANINEWNGTFTPQIMIEEYDLRENTLLDF